METMFAAAQKGISHTARREKEEMESENTLNFMTWEEKKEEIFTPNLSVVRNQSIRSF